MVRAYYNDKRFDDAVHINDVEADLLRNYHFMQMEKIKPKIIKLEDKADGSTKYDNEISELRNTLDYHKSSHDEACRIIRFHSMLKPINNHENSKK